MAGVPSTRHRLHRQGVGEILERANRGRLQGAQAPSAIHQGGAALQGGASTHDNAFAGSGSRSRPSSVCGRNLGRICFHEEDHSGSIYSSLWLSDSLRVQDLERGRTLLAESELSAIGTGSGEAFHVRPVLLGTTLVSKTSASMDTDSASGKTTATTCGTPKKTRRIRL